MKHSLFVLLASFLASCAHQEAVTPETTTMKLMRLSQEESQKLVDYPASASLDTIQKAQRVAFVSGVDTESSIKIWSAVQDAKPDLVVVVGSSAKPFQEGLSTEDPFANLDKIHEYSELRYRTPFLSTWSDLETPPSKSVASPEVKARAKAKYTKYWTYIPSVQPENLQGLEHSVMLGDAENRLQIILLDNFYYSEQARYSKSRNTFVKDWSDGKSILGKEQWSWLKSELKKDAKYRIIVSPQQLGINTGDYKRWGLFPQERQKFFDLIRSLRIKNLLIVSNGVGYGAIAKVNLVNFSPLYDISVGPNQNFNLDNVDRSHVVQGPFDVPNFGIVDIDAKNITLKNVGEDKKVLGKVLIKQ